MAIVVRLGPVPLQHRRTGRIGELERIFGRTIELVEVSTTAELVSALATPGVIGVALDAAPPGELAGAVAAAHPLPVLRPLWRRQRNPRGETDDVFDGYGLLSGTDVSSPRAFTHCDPALGRRAAGVCGTLDEAPPWKHPHRRCSC